MGIFAKCRLDGGADIGRRARATQRTAQRDQPECAEHD
jgi:hypothetical protein